MSKAALDLVITLKQHDALSKKLLLKKCEKCKTPFVPRNEEQRYCGVRCANSALAAKVKNGVVIACDFCGGRSYLSLSQYRQKVNHPNWHKRCPDCVMAARRA